MLPKICNISLTMARKGDRMYISPMAFPSVQQLPDRRSNYRYPVNAALQYKTEPGHRASRGSVGSTVNMSSSGVLFQSAKPLPDGIQIELSIAWPTKLNNTVSLNLHVKGITVRTQGGYTAVQISKSEFRTRATPSAKYAENRRLSAVSQFA